MYTSDKIITIVWRSGLTFMIIPLLYIIATALIAILSVVLFTLGIPVIIAYLMLIGFAIIVYVIILYRLYKKIMENELFDGNIVFTIIGRLTNISQLINLIKSPYVVADDRSF